MVITQKVQLRLWNEYRLSKRRQYLIFILVRGKMVEKINLLINLQE